MNTIPNTFFDLFIDPIIRVQEQKINIFERGLWNNNPDTTILFYVLGGISVIIALIILASYQYQKWKQYSIFEDEMKGLGMDAPTEDTLAGMVKRLEMDEPVQVLFSKRLFDEMASREILKVLSSPGSVKAKQKFIDDVYTIRNKAYSSDWLKDIKEQKIPIEDSAEDLPDWLKDPKEIN